MTDRPPLFPEGSWHFVVDGKTYWPACLTVVLSRHAALSLVGNLASRLANYPHEELFPVNWPGTIERLVEDDDD